MSSGARSARREVPNTALERAATLAGAALLLLSAACVDRASSVRFRPAAQTAAAFPPGPQGHLLPAASDDPSGRINPLLPWPPEPEPERGEAAPRLRSGLRAGVVALERTDWVASARAGLFLERRLKGGAWLALGLDGGQEVDTATSMDLFVLRTQVGVTGAIDLTDGARFRPTYSLAVAYEWARIQDVGMSFDRYALLGGLGFRIGPPSERWDVRAEYLLLVNESDIDAEAFGGLVLRF